MNKPKSTAKYKICIDSRLYGISHTGIGRYTQQLISNLPKTKDIEVVLITSPENNTHPDLKDYHRFVSYTHPYSFLSQLELPLLYFRIKPDLLHVPFSSIPVFWPGKIIATFHDLIKHISKGTDTTTKNSLFYWLKYYSFLAVDFISAKRVSKIFTPTNFWKNKILNKYHLPENKIIVTYEAVDDNFPIMKPKKVLGLKRPFIVHTGNLYPHKNITVVFNALKNIPVNLYLICARSVFADRIEKQINELGLSQKIFFLGKLTDEEVRYVYRYALALVFPSKIEGFGLNGLEAMSVGLPVISSRASCLPEVYGDAALYFDPDNPADLEHNIKMLQNNYSLRNKMITNGLKQVSKYNWADTARKTWNVYLQELL